jgi:nitrite reductase (NADH) small subunit
MSLPILAAEWTSVCDYDDLLPERGVAALLADEQVAIYRLADGGLRAIGNLDPFSGAYVLSRGIVGSRGDAPTVASPIGKQVFDLDTGISFDDPEVSVATYSVRVGNGAVQVCIAE